MSVINNLKKIRMNEYTMEQKEFAEYLKVSLKNYNNWELGNSRPKLELALEIARKLNKSVEEIWYLD